MEKERLDIAIKEWMENHKKNSIKTLSYDRLVTAYKLMSSYPIAALPVDQIVSRDIQKYLNGLTEDGYSMSTIRKQFNLITGYWKWALSQGLVANPIYLGANLPSEEALLSPSREIEAYSHWEQDILMERLMGLEKDQYGVVVLMLEAGLRIGEALALTWDDILWQRKAIRIHRTLIRKSSEPVTYVQDSPKTKKSKRTIPLSDRALEVLQRLNVRKNRCRYIFCDDETSKMPFSYSSVEFHVRHLCKDLDISYHGLHSFRHTFATNCYERGCDVKILSKLLGHANVAITYNTYIHLYGDALEEMRKVIG